MISVLSVRKIYILLETEKGNLMMISYGDIEIRPKWSDWLILISIFLAFEGLFLNFYLLMRYVF